MREDVYYHFVDKKNPNNSFIIYKSGKGMVSNPDISKFTVLFRPADSIANSERITQLTHEATGKQLKGWFEVLELYASTPSIYDDPIIDSYADYYAKMYPLRDEDADTAPFNPNEQLLLETNLNSLKELAQTELATKPELLNEVNSEIDETKAKMSQETKATVHKRIMRVLARIYKSAKPFAKKAIDTLIVEGVKFTIEQAAK